MIWDDLAARARGLASHLLSTEARRALDRARDLEEALALLRAAGYAIGADRSPAALERAVRRRVAADLSLLAFWAKERSGVLAALFEDEDRRSLRALLRGSFAGAPAAERLADAVPTPLLPERALEELARQPSAAAIAVLLRLWRHPYAPALAGVGQAVAPDLLALELELTRTYARRGLAGAGRDRALRAFVRGTIDVENAWSAQLLSGRGRDLPPEDSFLEGGRRISRDAFLDAARAPPKEAGPRLATAFPDTRLGDVLRAGRADAVESAALEFLIREQAALARIWPSGPAPVIAFALRRREEAQGVRRALWRLWLPSGEAAA